MVAASNHYPRCFPTLVPGPLEVESEAQAMRAIATNKRVQATKLLKEAADMEAAAAAKEKRLAE